MLDLMNLSHREYVIANVTVVDPRQGRMFPGCVGVKDGRIDFVEKGGVPSGVTLPVYDGEGLHLAPGFVDIHVHLREPGHEYKETVATGTAAAVAGGFTSVACMPNTDPAVDERSVVEYIIKQARIAGKARVYPIAAATVGRRGETLTEYHELKDAGAVAVSDDGAPVANAAILRRVFEYASGAGLPLIEHCEDMAASGDGVMNESYTSTRLGLRGIPAYSEVLCLARDIIVLESVPGARLHAAHMSAKGSLEQLRRAKDKGLAVTAETAPHYICLTDEDLATYNTSLRINPPIRGAEDRVAMIEALKDGTVDCIASDHAPHAPQEKQVEFDQSPPGSVGLETTFPLVMTHLVRAGHMKLPQALALITHKPAECIGIPGGTLDKGAQADLTLFDPDEEWVVLPGSLHSKSRNCAFIGNTVYGRVKHTIVGGAHVSGSLIGAR